MQLATAAAPEGPSSLARWHELGRASAERLGVQQVVVPVVDRVSADDDALAGLVAGAGLVYLSGGNPPFLATHAARHPGLGGDRGAPGAAVRRSPAAAPARWR